MLQLLVRNFVLKFTRNVADLDVLGIAGELQFLMETEGDLCNPSAMLEGGMPIHKPASSNSIADGGGALYPATPPQNILSKRCAHHISP